MKKLHMVSMVLHAHLPFVRHPEFPTFLEERWLFEAISESYMPLLGMFERLEADGIPFSIAISLSPTLCQMLGDPLLQTRYVEHLDRLIAFGELELARCAGRPAEEALVRLYLDRAVDDRARFVDRYNSNLLHVFDVYQRKGFVELMTTAATHAFLPFLQASPESLRAQVEVALNSHRSFFGRNPSGFWLPDLGWCPEAGELLRSYGFSYTIVDTHGLLHARPVPSTGPMAPVLTGEGLCVFGRNHASARQVWDREQGFPTDPVYRDFYRDAGFELPLEALEPLLEADSVRGPTGFKYWANAKDTDTPLLWDPALASKRVDEHVEEFLAARVAQAAVYEEETGNLSHALCAYNAELFGHWWYEGPLFLERLFRRIHESADIRFVKPSHAMDVFAEKETIAPQCSTWGTNGYAESWLDISNDWTWRHIILCAHRMTDLTERFPDESGLKERSLNQAAREVLLSQASDWQFLMKDRSAPDYAKNRFEDAVRNFITAYESLGGNYISTDWLTKLEKRNNLFPDINYRVFAKKL